MVLIFVNKTNHMKTTTQKNKLNETKGYETYDNK